MSIGSFPESLSQAMLVGIMLVGGLGVQVLVQVCWSLAARGACFLLCLFLFSVRAQRGHSTTSPEGKTLEETWEVFFL